MSSAARVARLGEEEAGVEAARAAGRGDGAEDEGERGGVRHEAGGEEAAPAGRHRAGRGGRVGAAEHQAGLLPELADGGERQGAGDLAARSRRRGAAAARARSGARSASARSSASTAPPGKTNFAAMKAAPAPRLPISTCGPVRAAAHQDDGRGVADGDRRQGLTTPSASPPKPPMRVAHCMPTKAPLSRGSSQSDSATKKTQKPTGHHQGLGAEGGVDDQHQRREQVAGDQDRRPGRAVVGAVVVELGAAGRAGVAHGQVAVHQRALAAGRAAPGPAAPERRTHGARRRRRRPDSRCR